MGEIQQTAISPIGSSTATVNMGHNMANMSWVMAQVSVGTDPFVPGATAIISKGSQKITSTPVGSADGATGDPPILLGAGETLTVNWTGLDATQQVICSATGYYNEIPLTYLSTSLGGQGAIQPSNPYG